MKKLITTDLGGQPVYFKDFEFIQEMIRELSQAALGSNDSSKVTVLNSFEYNLSTDGYTINVTNAGFAYYQGEMFYIPIQSATGSSPNVLKWSILESNDLRGLKTFKDETVGDKNVYKVRTLQLVYLPSTSTNPNFTDTILPTVSYPWSDAVLINSWIPTPPNNFRNPRSGLKYRINKSGKLELIGSIRNTMNIAAGSVIFVLPIGFRPDFREHFRITSIDWCPLSCFIDPNGSVVFVNLVDLSGTEPPSFTNLYNAYDDIYFNNEIILNTND